MKQTKQRKEMEAWTLEDAAHFIVYRELDKLRVQSPYKVATIICNELREAVQYRSVFPSPQTKKPSRKK